MSVEKHKNTQRSARLSVAPMMDWTDRHCRFFHRQLTTKSCLYTEMVTAKAIIHGDRDRLLAFCPEEAPVILQLGGAVPDELAHATKIAYEYGYQGVNLNCGCPSPRVQSGAFGAALMRDPQNVQRALEAMSAASPLEVSVKCRIGVDDDTPEIVLPHFLTHIRASGTRKVIIHARKAWLDGLSPKENRTIPPLNYDLVFAMQKAFPGLVITLNGGIKTLAAAKALLERGINGVMIGRAAYQNPGLVLHQADQEIFNAQTAPLTAKKIITIMADYIEAHCQNGGHSHQVTRHMLGLFNGQSGARAWRQTLSSRQKSSEPGPAILLNAFAKIQETL